MEEDPGVNGVIFDCDGVIANTSPSNINDVAESITELRLPNDNNVTENIRKSWGKPYEEIFKCLGMLYGWNSNQIQQVYLKTLAKPEKIQPVPGMSKFLMELSQQLPTAIVSNRLKEHGIKLLKQLELDNVPFKVQFRDDYHYHKPDHRCFGPTINRIIREQKGLPKNRPILYLGDTVENDLAPTIEWFPIMIFVAVVSGASTTEEFLAAGVPPTRIIEGIDAIPEKLPTIIHQFKY